MGARHLRLGQPRQLLAARRRRTGSALSSQTTSRSSPTSSDSTSARARRRHPRVEPAVVGAVLLQLVEEPRRLLVLSGHRPDEQRLLRPAHCQVEQPPFLRQDRRGRGDGVIVHTGHQVLQPFHAQHGSAKPQVRPSSLLNTRDGDDRPLATCGRVRGQQRYPVRRHGRRRQRVTHDLLCPQVIREGRDARARQPVDVPAGGVEQRHDGVEVAVGLRAQRSPAFDLLQQLVLQPASVPQLPQHLLDAVAARHGLVRDAQQPADAPHRFGLGVGEPGEDVPAAQRFDEQFVARPLAAPGQFEPTQTTTQPAQRQRIRAAERRRQQHLGEVDVEEFGRGRELQHGQQRPHRGLARQRQLLGRRADRDAGGAQGPLQHQESPRRRPDEHRDLRPRHAVDEVRAAELVGDPAGLGGRRRHHADPHVPAGSPRGRDDLAVLGQPGQRRADLRHGQANGRGEPVGRRERDGPAAVRVGVGEQARVGAAEGEHVLVGVAGDDELRRGVPDHPDQAGLQRVEVVGVVDEQVPHAGALAFAQLVVVFEGEQRGGDQLGGIQRGRARHAEGVAARALQLRDLFVLRPELPGGDPLLAAATPAQLGEVLRTQPAFGGAHQQVAQLLGEPGDHQRRPQLLGPVACLLVEVAGQQLADDDVLLGAGEQPRRRELLGHRLQAQQRVGVRVDRADEGFADGARQRPRLVGVEGEPAGDVGAQRVRGLAGRGEHQHALRVGPLGDAAGGGRREQRRLAGAGTAEHAAEAPGCGEHAAGAFVPGERGCVGDRRAHQPRVRPPRSPRVHPAMEPRPE